MNSKLNRKLTQTDPNLINFSTNDYLALSTHPALLKSLKTASQVGSTGSRLLSGNSPEIETLESELSTWLKKPSALVFNSGYQMNTGIIPTLSKKNDLILLDKLAHASLIDGTLRSPATHYRFKHNDMTHLEQLLKTHRKNHNNCYIITESIFSMDGDKAPLDALIKLKTDHNAKLILDEAHAIGVFGDGKGLAAAQNHLRDIDILLATFGKAFATAGAFIACTPEIKTQLINTCRAFIYSTALPLPITIATQTSLDLIQIGTERKQLQTLLKTSPSTTQIIPIIIGPEDKTISLSEKLKASGNLVLPIRPPTVPKGSSRLRISLNAAHTQAQFETLLNEIKKEK